MQLNFITVSVNTISTPKTKLTTDTLEHSNTFVLSSIIIQKRNVRLNRQKSPIPDSLQSYK
jgi:hypothetical protein